MSWSRARRRSSRRGRCRRPCRVTHRGGDPRLGEPGAEGETRVLGSPVRVVDEPRAGSRAARAASRAARTRLVRRWSAIDQPTTRRLKTSTIAARWRKPSPVGEVRDVGDPEPVGSLRAEVAPDEVGRGRRARCAGRGPGLLVAGGGRRRGCLAHEPGDPLAPTRQPSARRAAWTRGDPYVPRLATWTARIVASRAASAATRPVAGPRARPGSRSGRRRARGTGWRGGSVPSHARRSGTPSRRPPGLPSAEGRCFCQDLPLLLEDPEAAPESDQLGVLLPGPADLRSASAARRFAHFRIVSRLRPRSRPTDSLVAPGSANSRTAAAWNSAEYVDLLPNGHLLQRANNSVSTESGQAQPSTPAFCCPRRNRRPETCARRRRASSSSATWPGKTPLRAICWTVGNTRRCSEAKGRWHRRAFDLREPSHDQPNRDPRRRSAAPTGGDRFGEELRMIRLRTGVSQAAVARAIGVDRASLCRIEAGDPTVSDRIRARAAAVLGADFRLGIYPDAAPLIHDAAHARIVEAAGPDATPELACPSRGARPGAWSSVNRSPPGSRRRDPPIRSRDSRPRS